MIAEGAFGPEFIQVHVSLQHDLGIGWNFQVDGFALHQFDRLLAQESGDNELLNVRRSGHNRGESQRRLCADGYGYVHSSAWPLSDREHRASRRTSHDVHCGTALTTRTSLMLDTLPQAVPVMLRCDFLPLPMHASRRRIMNLHSIHTDVPLPCFRIARDHTR